MQAEEQSQEPRQRRREGKPDGQQRRRGRTALGKESPHPPQVGKEAPEFELLTPDGEKVSLRKLTGKSRVVLLVLRGWPGYQCPICSRQVGDFLSKKKEFEERGVQVVMIYPGPAELLNEHAKEFQGKRLFTGSYHYVTDPDYKFTNAWGLRWEAERETAYASTFIIGQNNLIEFGETSTTHGGRTSAATILKALDKQPDESAN